MLAFLEEKMIKSFACSGKTTTFNCEACPKSFETENEKNIHILEHLARYGEFCGKCDKSLIRIGAELYVLHTKFTCIKSVETPSESESEESPLTEPLIHIESIIVENEMPIFKEETDYVVDDWSNHDGDSMVDLHYSSDDENINDTPLPQPSVVIETNNTAVKQLDIPPDNVDIDTPKILEPQTIVSEPPVDNNIDVIQNEPNETENGLMAEDIEDIDDDNIEDDKEEEYVDEDNKNIATLIEKPHLIEKRLAQTLKRRIWKNKYDATPVQCTVDGCNKMIKRRSIYTHMASHRGEKLECDICHDLLSTR